MSTQDTLLQQFGEEGKPLVLSDELKDTWQLYVREHAQESKQSPRDRILSVLGFWHLVRQSGMTRYFKMTGKPETLYKELRTEEFAEIAGQIARQLVKYRLFDVLRVFKSKFSIVRPVRGDSLVFQFYIAFEPKKSEPLDSALTRLQGLLYTGDLPMQLREQWKKRPVNSNAKPKSARPTYLQLMGRDSSIGFLPLAMGTNFSLFAARAADDMLVLRISLTVSLRPVPWTTERKHVELLSTLLSKSLSKLKG